MKKSITVTLYLWVAFVFMAQVASATVIYVDSGAAGGNDGTSWANAYAYLQDAFDAAVGNDEIHVATGTYYPDQGGGRTLGDREASFVLVNLVRVLGGFPAGGGTLQERDWQTHETILTGDLNGDDDPNTLVQNLLTDPTRADNCYTVIYSDLCGPPTLLDGLIITGGQANSTGAPGLDNGGGWYSITNSSPTVTNCTFTRNAAQNRGGAWYNRDTNSRPTLTNVTFTMNYCANRGGAVAMLNTGADVELDGCVFNQNRAGTHGGSLYLDRSSPTVLNSDFSGDYAPSGGSIAGIDTSGPTITNTSFSGSSATNGGAVWADSCRPSFYDCVFTTNTATASGGVAYFSGGNAWFDNCDFTDNQAVSGTVYHTSSNLFLDDCDFIENRAQYGGAIYTRYGTSEITGSLFFKNSATANGGAIENYAGRCNVASSRFIGNHSNSHGGAILNQAFSSGGHAYLTGWNCLFVGNYVTDTGANGGAIASFYYYWSGNHRYTYTTLINSTLYGNTAVDVGGGIYTNHGTSTNKLKNCIMYENLDTSGSLTDESAQLHGGGNTVQYSCIQGLTGYADNGNTGDDPEFADPLGPDWLPGTLDDNLRLTSGSPAVDAGNNALAAGLTEDLDGLLRFWDDPGTPDTGVGADPNDPIVDMGAYEFQPGGVFFADANLRKAVEDELAKQGISPPFTEIDMGKLTYLDARSMGITDLTGLECAENLVKLYLYSNEISDIEPISTLQNLDYVHLSYNQIESLPVISSWTKIRYLYLHGNSISDFARLTSPEITRLINLYIYDNDTPLSIEACGIYIPAIIANNPDLVNFRHDSCCEPMLAGDVNEDCTFNLADLAIMGSGWLRCTHIYQELCL